MSKKRLGVLKTTQPCFGIWLEHNISLIYVPKATSGSCSSDPGMNFSGAKKIRTRMSKQRELQ